MAGHGRRSLATDYIMDKLLRMKLTSDRAIIGRRGSRGRTARGEARRLRCTAVGASVFIPSTKLAGH